MQYKVPQNVDIEDKVIAGLTLRQFTFLMIAGSLMVGVWVSLPETLGFMRVPLCSLLAMIGLALAFYKINDRPFEVFLISAFKTLITPSRRIWVRETEPTPEIVVEEKPKKPKTDKKNVNEIRSNLEQLAMLVDSGVATEITRQTNIKPLQTNEPQNVHDILEKTEKSSEHLDDLISKARLATSPSKEKPISTMASFNPSQKQYKYDNIQLGNETAMEEMLEAANEKQREQEEKLRNAKIEKF